MSTIAQTTTHARPTPALVLAMAHQRVTRLSPVLSYNLNPRVARLRATVNR